MPPYTAFYTNSIPQRSAAAEHYSFLQRTDFFTHPSKHNKTIQYDTE